MGNAAGAATDIGLTIRYWNTTQPTEVCEASGQIVSCGTWTGPITITSCNDPGNDSMAGCLAAVYPFAWGFPSGTLTIGAGGSGNNIRTDSPGPPLGPVCNGWAIPFDLLSTNSLALPYNLSGIHFSAASGLDTSVTLMFTVTGRTATSISGTFTESFQYPTGGDYTAATGTASGTWSLAPSSKPFQQCVVPTGYQTCESSGIAVAAYTTTTAPCTY